MYEPYLLPGSSDRNDVFVLEYDVDVAFESDVSSTSKYSGLVVLCGIELGGGTDVGVQDGKYIKDKILYSIRYIVTNVLEVPSKE